MRLMRIIALSLAICLLWAALAEGQDIAYEEIEVAVAPAEFVGDDTGLTVEVEEAPPEIEVELQGPVDADEAWDGEADRAESKYGASAPASERRYARASSRAPLYFDTETGDVIAELVASEVVLSTGECDGFATVAINAGSGIVEGFMDRADLTPLSDAETAAYLDAAAASGDVALYANDLNWPLSAISAASRARAFSVLAANYTEYNNTVFKINGKEIYAKMVPDTGSGNCWRWAQNMYKILWGCQFNEKFEGTAATGLNLLRNLGDDDRLLTPEHLKYFVQNAQPGATIRVCGCSTKCPQFNNDGLSCGHKGHSLIIVDKNADGVITMDSHSNSQHTRFYSWQGFCNSWKNYTYVKYIKWPNAPALAPSNAIDGYAVSAYSETYRVRATSEKGAIVYAKPADGNVLATLAYPDTFTATRKAANSIGGHTWVYGATQSGVTGWLALDGNVANVNDAIAVTDMSLSQSQLLLLVGNSATLTAAIAPADATNQKLSWSSDNTAVAVVKGGKVTAVSSGTATITATTPDGAKSATCAVKTAPAEGSKKLKKTGSNGTIKLCIGQKLQIVPTFATKKGWKIKSATSSKSKVAPIDKKGVVTAKAEGKTKITVKTKNKKKATLTVQVVDPFKPTKIVLSKKGTVKLKKGAKLKLYTKLSPSTAVSALIWKSSKPKIANVDGEGNVTAYKKGTCYIGVMTENGKYAKVKIKVS